MRSSIIYTHSVSIHALNIMTMRNELALLGFLRDGPAHGYAIHQALSDPDGLGLVWTIKLSHLYALLGKLEDAGYLTSTTEPQEGRPPRKLFQLTAAGERVFLEWVEQPVQSGRSLRLDFLIKLYFARRESAAVVARLLAGQRDECQRWLAAEQALAETDSGAGRQYSGLVHRFRQGQIEAMLAWLDQCEEA